MLTAFIDDSGINQAPVSLLAGWVAPAAKWAEFSDARDKVLWMSPRIRYFKYAEATAGTGEFQGISEASRVEKLDLLVSTIEEHNLLGVATVVPHDIFHAYFGRHDAGVLKHPYPISFYQIIGRLYRHFATLGIKEKIDLVFDDQPNQRLKVMEGWEEFVKHAPPEHKAMISSPPSFRDDMDVLPLQAADLHAGWVRQLDAAAITGVNLPVPLWRPRRGDKIQRLNWVMTDEVARDLRAKLAAYS